MAAPWIYRVLTEQLDKGAEDLKRALELDPDLGNVHYFLSEVYIMEGKPLDALPEIKRVQEDDLRLHQYALAYYTLGRKREADTALNELTAKYQAVEAYNIATIYAFRNEFDKAFEWLGRAYAQHNTGLVETKVDPLLKSLHNEPMRFFENSNFIWVPPASLRVLREAQRCAPPLLGSIGRVPARDAARNRLAGSGCGQRGRTRVSRYL